jgi:hypothetical protein
VARVVPLSKAHTAAVMTVRRDQRLGTRLSRLAAVAAMAALMTACSSSSSGAKSSIGDCQSTESSGSKVVVTLQNSNVPPSYEVAVGGEVIVRKRPNPAASLMALPKTKKGAFCKRSEDAVNWYLIASRTGDFDLSSYFPDVVGTNLMQSNLQAIVMVVTNH